MTHPKLNGMGGLKLVEPVAISMAVMATVSTSEALQLAPAKVAFPEFLKASMQLLKFELHVLFK